MSRGAAWEEVMTAGTERPFLDRFHDGERDAIEACYRDHHAAVSAAVGRLLDGADRESIVHELFLRLLTRPEVRRAFTGGSLRAWLTTLARNQAIDLLRRRNRERPLDEASLSSIEDGAAARAAERAADARLLVDQFVRERLPDKWRGVFEARFLEQLDQRAAAKKLGLHRTTLAYQELRVRSLLRRFLVEGER